VTRSAESGTRARTRQAIIAAAASVFAEHPSASLSDIAAAADVARSTLHRYFADRAELINALADHAIERGDAAVADAAVDDGPAEDALRRLARSYFDLGPLMTFLLQEHERRWAGPPLRPAVGGRRRAHDEPSPPRPRGRQLRRGVRRGVDPERVLGAALHRVGER